MYQTYKEWEMKFEIDGRVMSGEKACGHFIEWCLALEQSNDLCIPHSVLDAIRVFQNGAYRKDPVALDLLLRSGLKI